MPTIRSRNVRIQRLGDADGEPTEAFEIAGIAMVQHESWEEPTVIRTPPGCREVVITGEFVFRTRVEWLRAFQVVMGIKPSIKYGEHKWGAFA